MKPPKPRCRCRSGLWVWPLLCPSPHAEDSSPEPLSVEGRRWIAFLGSRWEELNITCGAPQPCQGCFGWDAAPSGSPHKIPKSWGQRAEQHPNRSADVPTRSGFLCIPKTWQQELIRESNLRTFKGGSTGPCHPSGVSPSSSVGRRCCSAPMAGAGGGEERWECHAVPLSVLQRLCLSRSTADEEGLKIPNCSPL